MSDRNGVLRGESLSLIATFFNSLGELDDPIDLSISIYPPLTSPGAEEDALVYGASLTDGGTGPLADASNLVEKLTDGVFQYTVTLPLDMDTGSAIDYWTGVLGGETVSQSLSFEVLSGGTFRSPSLKKNNRVTLYLSSTIAAIDGSTLESEDQEKYFTTEYDPLYASVTQLRLNLGPIAKDLSDDTINLAIFEASLSADSNIFLDTIENSRYFKEAKKGYVVCKAQLILLQALSSDGSLTGGFKKTLGDLSVSKFGNDDFIKSRLNNLENCVEGWLSVIKSGGGLTPFASPRAQYTVKGANSSDAISVGREWSPIFSGERPIANSSSSRHDMTSSRRKYRTYVPRSGRGPKW